MTPSPSRDFIALALHGKKFGFGLVIKTFDDRTVVLQMEQRDDENQNEFFDEQLELSCDKKNVEEEKIADMDLRNCRVRGGNRDRQELIDALEDASAPCF